APSGVFHDPVSGQDGQECGNCYLDLIVAWLAGREPLKPQSRGERNADGSVAIEPRAQSQYLVTDGSDDGNEHNTRHNAQEQPRMADHAEDEYRHQNYPQKERSTASHVNCGESLHCDGSQLRSSLPGVYRLVLRAVIFKHAAHLTHLPNE